MKNDFNSLLDQWPNSIISDNDLTILLSGTADRRYGLIKRALKNGRLIHLKKGLYFISRHYKNTPPNLFEIAQRLYGPSYISLESALSYHNWIPEAVYTTTSVSPQRNNHFKTPFGVFHFSHVPSKNFYIGVERIESTSGIFLMASPLKALTDYVYVYRKVWKNFQEIHLDLRVEMENLKLIDKTEVKLLFYTYSSKRVRMFLMRLHEELTNGY